MGKKIHEKNLGAIFFYKLTTGGKIQKHFPGGGQAKRVVLQIYSEKTYFEKKNKSKKMVTIHKIYILTKIKHFSLDKTHTKTLTELKKLMP